MTVSMTDGRSRASAALSLLLLLASCGGPYRMRSGREVAFEGNDATSDGDLWEVSRSDVEAFDETGESARLSDAAFRIAHLYELRGRGKTQVDVREEPGRIVFSVREERYYALGKIRIEGARGVPEEELLAALPGRFLGSLPYSQLLVRELSGRIAGLYRDRGYKDVEVGPPELRPDPARHVVDVRFRVQEGKAYRVSRVTGIEQAPEELAHRLRTLEGKPYTPQSPETVQAVVLDYYREHGYPFVRVTAEPEVHPEDATVRIVVSLEPGRHRTIGDVQPEGLQRATASFVRSRAGLESGREYRSSDLRRAEERLNETNLFETVQAEPGRDDPAGDELPIVLRLKERDPGEVGFRLGYGTLDGLRAGVDLRYSNLLGNAELFRIGGTISRFGYRAESELAFPYFLGSEFRPGLSGYYETETYPAFDATSYGEAVSLSHPLVTNVTGTLGVRHAVIRTSNVDPGVPPGDLLDFAYTAPFVTLHWEGRDNALLPTRGGFLDTRFEVSDRSYSPDIQFWNLTGRLSYLVPLPAALTLGASFQGGVIAPIQGTQEIPISLRYFAGGTSSVRGFPFASLGPQVNGEAIGGEAFLALQVELRFPIWQDLHGAVFTDRGGVWTDYTRVDLGDLRYSVGTGLRYLTPAGPLVADFAWNPARRAGEDGWAFHFSIGYPF
jgi:outer membrane protein insertion porin family